MRQYLVMLRYGLRQWRWLLAIVSLNVIAGLVAALQPWPMKLLIDSALGHAAPGQPPGLLDRLVVDLAPAQMILLVAAAVIALFVANTVLSSAVTWLWTVAGRRMVYDLATDVFARLQRLSHLFHRRRTVGDALSRIAVDTWSVYTVTDALLIAPARSLFTIVTIGIIAWRLDSQLTLLGLTVVPALAALTVFYGRRQVRRARAKRRAEARLFSFVQQTLSALPVVQAFSAEDRNTQHLKELSDTEIDRIRRDALVRNGFVSMIVLATTLSVAFMLVAGGRRVLAGSLSVGSFLVFLAYMRTIQGAIRRVLENYSTLKSAQANLERVFEVLDAKELVRDAPGAVPLEVSGGRGGLGIRLENVVFGYEPSRAVLKGVTLEIAAGETVALVGVTGAGKSTLVSLVPRFFDPWEGRVVVGGRDVREVQLKSLRDQVGLVLQEPFILPLSIADNIAYGRPHASREEIEAVARAANAHEFVERLPEGYGTVVGERGATLSGGERQRLAIARAFLKDAPILILDEPTSALDAGSESLVLAALERLMKGRTVLVIAHRLSTVRRADRIVVLEQGVIVEQGTHDELLAAAGRYRDFHDKQYAVSRNAVTAAG